MKKVNYRKGDKGNKDRKKLKQYDGLPTPSEFFICRYCKHWRRYGFGYQCTSGPNVGTYIPGDGFCHHSLTAGYPGLWSENEGCSRWEKPES